MQGQLGGPSPWRKARSHFEVLEEGPFQHSCALSTGSLLGSESCAGSHGTGDQESPVTSCQLGWHMPPGRLLHSLSPSPASACHTSGTSHLPVSALSGHNVSSQSPEGLKQTLPPTPWRSDRPPSLSPLAPPFRFFQDHLLIQFSEQDFPVLVRRELGFSLLSPFCSFTPSQQP